MKRLCARSRWLRLALLLALAPAACGPMYIYGHTTHQVLAPRAAGCVFGVLEAPPPRDFDEIGILAPEDIAFGSTAGGSTSFVDQVRDQVCQAGGDAVIVERDWQMNYERATVIRFKP